MNNIENKNEEPSGSPLLSLVIPACGCAKYLPDLFASLEAQTFRDFEVLFAVEESGDRSVEICQEWCERQRREGWIPAQTFALKRTGAGGASRNTCYRHAKGRYLVPLDGDDWFEPDALQIIADSIAKNSPDVLLGSAKVWLCNDAGECKATDMIIANLPQDQDGAVMDGVEIVRRVARSGQHFRNHGAIVIVERKFLLDNDLFQLEGIPSEDGEWTPRVILKARKIAFIGRAYYNYRRRDGSVSSTKDARILHATARIALKVAQLLDEAQVPEDVKRPLSNDAISIFNWYLFNRTYARRFTRRDRLEAIRFMTGTPENNAFYRRLFACTSSAKRFGLPLVLLAAKTGWLLPATLYYRYVYYPMTRFK